MKTLVIIPAFNEAANIGGLIKNIKKTAPGLDILVIDDGSIDDTAAISANSGALVVRHPFNMGYGVALQTGYKYADINKYDSVVQLDADGQHDPNYISGLLKELERNDADVVIGSRHLSNTKYNARLSRKIGMGLFSGLVSLIIGRKITDSTSGFQALNRNVFKFFTGDIYPYDYPDADVIIMLHRAGFRIKEAPLVMYANNGSKSMHSGLKPVYYMFKMMLSIFVTLLRKQETHRYYGCHPEDRRSEGSKKDSSLRSE